MSASLMPQALFGGLLWGDSAMRFVFVDEAGTSESEPVTVVVGLIVDADKQLMFAEAAVQEALVAVPAKYREAKDFVFHSKEIWGSQEYRADWSMTDRKACLKSMMALPRRLNIPITVSMIRRNSGMGDSVKPTSLSKAQFQHVMAFAQCMQSADRYIRNYAALNEVATVVAEDVPEMRKFLSVAPSIYRDAPRSIEEGMFLPTAKEREQGFIEQSGEMRVSRIRRNIHFVGKGDPLLLLADACAFAFRRFFAEQQFGDEFVQAVMGSSLNIEDYRGPMSVDNFYSHPRAV